jgi:hypothetical protein
LPDQPGGYDGYRALFGAKAIGAHLASNPPLKDLMGKPIQDTKGKASFPGFDALFPGVSLSYAAQFVEAGVPIVNVYISDAHDDHAHSAALGPGSADHEAQLAFYDQAFAAFFDRLQKDGLNDTNTLFVLLPTKAIILSVACRSLPIATACISRAATRRSEAERRSAAAFE